MKRQESFIARRTHANIFFISTALALSLIASPAQARGNGLIAERPIEDSEGRAMAAFHSSLRMTEADEAVTRIIHYGDSHVTADILTGAMRRSFQHGFGDAGAGFALAGRPWKWYSPVGGMSLASGGWQTDGLGAFPRDGRLGLAGVSLTTESAGEWIRWNLRGRYFDLYLLRQPAGGAIDVFLDGALIYQHALLASDRFEAAYLELEAGAEGRHTIEIRTAARGRVRVLGIAAESRTAGVVYDALGINGARASRPLAWNWDVLADNLTRRDPQLIIIAYGSNEAGDTDLDVSEYASRFTELLRRFQQAAPRASLLVISPPDRSGVGRRLPALVEAQRRAALRAGAAFWNLFEAMGGADSIERWARLRLAQSDRVHLTQSGYRLVAEALYKELMRGYLWSLLETESQTGGGATKLPSACGVAHGLTGNRSAARLTLCFQSRSRGAVFKSQLVPAAYPERQLGALQIQPSSTALLSLLDTPDENRGRNPNPAFVGWI